MFRKLQGLREGQDRLLGLRLWGWGSGAAALGLDSWQTTDTPRLERTWLCQVAGWHQAGPSGQSLRVHVCFGEGCMQACVCLPSCSVRDRGQGGDVTKS